MDIRHLLLPLKEDYKDTMNNLTSSEKAIIRDVSRKIRDDDIANKFYEIYRSREEERREQRDQQEQQSNQNKEKRRSIKIKAVGILCAGSLAYATAVLITR
jgi:isopropylmalate/homocitrate/citramalate synthase